MMKFLKRFIIILFVLLILGGGSFAFSVPVNGENVEIPNNLSLSNLGVRGVWVSTVWQAFPSKGGLSEEAYRSEYLKMLDNFEKAKINTVIFQICPSGDAFFKSKINPSSEFLTGVQGENLNFDPLPFMIEETHKRGMTFHAWINPYRITYKDMDGTKEELLNTLSHNNFAYKNPDCVFKAGKKLYLKPWDNRVVEHIKELVSEVIKNYNVDAIHFDDYFYPAVHLTGKDGYYEEEKQAFEKSGFSDIGEFRRAQTDNLVLSVYQTIQGYNRGEKKSVEFGISPLGVWNNKSVPDGMEVTTNYTSYATLFADTKKWVENNRIDYIVPQVYWDFNNKGASYGNVTDWWAKLCEGSEVKLYIGHANYKLASGDWKNPDEIYNQLAFNSMYPSIKGEMFFDAKAFGDKTSHQNKLFLTKYTEEIQNLLNPHKNSVRDTVKIELYKTPQGNLLHWVYSGDFRYFTIIKNDKEFGKIEKSGNSYFYLDYGDNSNANYKIEVERE